MLHFSTLILPPPPDLQTPLNIIFEWKEIKEITTQTTADFFHLPSYIVLSSYRKIFAQASSILDSTDIICSGNSLKFTPPYRIHFLSQICGSVAKPQI